MDTVDRNAIQDLIRSTTPYAVSIYMPTHRDTQNEQKDRIRLKNHLRNVENALDERGCPKNDVARMIQPIETLLGERPFLRHLADGLALFLGTEGMRYFRTPIRFDDFIHIADRYHITPLIPLVHREGQFHILAVSKNNRRLLQANQHEAHEIQIPHVPGSMENALRFDNPEKQHQYHTGTQPRPGRRHAISHGHGVGIDDEKTNIERYLRHIDRGIHTVLPEDGREPLVLACAEPLDAIYAEINTYPGLLDARVSGNPDTLSTEELHSRAWEIVKPRWAARQREVVARYENSARRQPTSTEIVPITTKALNGAVEILFVAAGKRIWGGLASDEPRVIMHDERETNDQDLLNLAAAETLKHDGTVYCLPEDTVPGGNPAAALFRY